MAYVINKFNGDQLVVLSDGTLDTTTDINLLGKNYVGYGEVQNENFVYLLENFANDSPPPKPIAGQTWYNTDAKNLNLYDGTEWISVGSVVVSSTEPAERSGAFWFDQDSQQLFVYNGTDWVLIGPEALAGYGTTRTISRLLIDVDGVNRPVSIIYISGIPVGVISISDFTISASTPVDGFLQIKAGVNLSSSYKFNGSLYGNASTASSLLTARKINGISFDGANDITVRSSTTNSLSAGSYITGSSFDGSTQITWSIDATPDNIIGKIVARDSGGDFSANNITANFTGNLTGNVNSSGVSIFNRIEANEFVGATLSGNAFTASKLLTARTINGVSFDGTTNITIGIDAADLTGNRLSSTVVQSNLQSLGTLYEARIADAGVFIGSSAQFRLLLSSSIPTVKSDVDKLNISIGNRAVSSHISETESISLGGESKPAIVPGDTVTGINLGNPGRKWDNVYANVFQGTASAARYADLAENYRADEYYEPGTVLDFGGSEEVTLSQTDHSNRIAGVVSRNPAYLMNSEISGDYIVPVALIGRVPCKVLGPIRKGDMLVSAGRGKARYEEHPKIGSIIGKSLEDFDGVSGIIEIVVGRI